MQLFYDSSISISDTQFLLNEEESRHACKVLRMKSGDALFLLDGKGHLFTTEIIDAQSKKCVLKIKEVKSEVYPNVDIHIAVAPTKNLDRIEWFVEKATEIGITEITWILCKNSERKVVKNERLEKIAISAMKQSKRLYLPKINELTSLKDFLKKHPKGAVAHCFENQQQVELKGVFEEKNFPILIGPEGDFSKEEVDMLLQNNYVGITLGKNRLRTETAALVACMQCVFI
jgi:16S rRNA (uracil1498-N3)-methyltransferase